MELITEILVAHLLHPQNALKSLLLVLKLMRHYAARGSVLPLPRAVAINRSISNLTYYTQLKRLVQRFVLWKYIINSAAIFE